MLDSVAEHELAQINLARLRHPLDSPITREFVRASPRISMLAESSPGFVWQYRTAEGHPSAAAETGDPRIVLNLSVWRSYEDLHAYVYRTTHFHFVRRRLRWFERIETPATALWWVPAGHRPTAAEGLARLAYLRSNGPTPRAFTVRTRFDPAGRRERPRAAR
jgi:hypothetical protein